MELIYKAMVCPECGREPVCILTDEKDERGDHYWECDWCNLLWCHHLASATAVAERAKNAG